MVDCYFMYDIRVQNTLKQEETCFNDRHHLVLSYPYKWRCIQNDWWCQVNQIYCDFLLSVIYVLLFLFEYYMPIIENKTLSKTLCLCQKQVQLPFPHFFFFSQTFFLINKIYTRHFPIYMYRLALYSFIFDWFPTGIRVKLTCTYKLVTCTLVADRQEIIPVCKDNL